MQKKGLMVVVSGPAGSGKGTVNAHLLATGEYVYSVSATTRAPRPGEVDGVNYHFITREEFEDRLAHDGMLEHTEYCGNYYGTPRKAVEDMLAAGKDVILKIEVEGAANVRKMFPDCTMIFILPPSFGELDRRLHKRGTEDEETIQRRIQTARGELTFARNYDYLIVNGALEKAVDDFLSVVASEKMRTKNSEGLIDALLSE